MIWSENKTVSPHHLDFNNVASASAILRYMQDAAYGQMYHNPPSMDDLRKENKVFVLSRLVMNVYAPLHVCEELVAESWACESRGASFLRCCRLKRGEETVAEVTAIWALVDAETKRLLRVSEYDPPYSCEPPLEMDAPARIRIPRDAEMTLVGEHSVIYSEVDINRHINNTNYPDILCSYAGDMRGKRVSRISLNYCHEAALGDTLKVYSAEGEEEGSVIFRTIRSDGQVNVEAEIFFDQL